jgi:beta-glucosidase
MMRIAESANRSSRYAAFVALIISATCSAAAPDSGSPEKLDAANTARVSQLLRDLTPEEKFTLLGGIGFATQPIPRLGIPSFKMSDGPSGTRTPPPSTAYAAGIGLAASWDAGLAREIGVQLGRDARSRGAQFLLGPGVNIYRAPMNGRNFEYFGEDPYLGSRIAVGYIEGVQSQGVSATIKHFVGNNSEFARNTSDSVIDERALREIYLPIFESAVKEARVGSVMSSYNLTNGTYMTANSYLADTVLKREWGFEGVYMSDWGATHDAIPAANARLDLEMPFGQFMNAATLGPAVRDKKVSVATLDDKVTRLLGLGARFGWLDNAKADLAIARYNQAGRDAARKGALHGMVLLKNAQNLLPLDAGKLKNIAVIGPLAHPAVSTAGGSGHVPEFTAVSFLQGMSDALRDQATVTYSRGIPSLRILGMLTPFRTDAADGKPGVTVETFAEATLAGTPLSTRIERQFATGTAGFGGDPDFLTVLDSLPASQSMAVIGALMAPQGKPTFERWTGWYTPAAAGNYTLFVQNPSQFRLLVDDKVVLDSSRIPRAALQQHKVALTAGAHKVVFEQKAPPPLGPPFWRVGFVREGTMVDPVAKELAARADAVVLAVGFDADSETESADREFALPPLQEELIREIAAVNPNTIVVITSGGSVDVAPWIDRARAVVAAWYPGQEGGTALASLLLGQANFSGRLPISWERVASDNPSYSNYYYNDAEHPDRIVYREGIFVGYRGYPRANVTPLFPFGFGLSYSTFRYLNLQVARAAGGTQPSWTVSFDVMNSGQRAGTDVAQIYVASERSKVPRPLRELKGFARVQLAPGETKRVTLQLDARAFAYYDVKAKGWRVEAGRYSIELGRSAADIELRATADVPGALMRTGY